MRRVLFFIAVVLTVVIAAVTAWVVGVAKDYRVVRDITYLTVGDFEAKLDVYTPRAAGPHPTVLHIHGGGWIEGSRAETTLRALPYLDMGFAVVNISYRLGPTAGAPAAVEDCLCALRWIIRNANSYGFDTSRIVTVGYSAGGHLALTTAMLPAAGGFDRHCPGPEPLNVAAVINWFGITDVAELLDGPTMQPYAVEWLGSRADRLDVARRVSPLTYVRKDVPPVLTIHGDADSVVPYSHATRLHAALQRAGATSELLTIPAGGHGYFSIAEQQRAYAAIRAFLTKHGIMRRAPTLTSEP